MNPRPTLSLVIPIFNEEAIILELHRRLMAFLEELGETWEVVFIDDGSRDQSLQMLRELAAGEERYRVVALSRNFGHQFAITAGLDRAAGEAVVVMDADLQDPPEAVGGMLALWRQGNDVVYGVRKQRLGETWFKRATAAVFYRLLRTMIGINIPSDAGDFRLMSRQVVLTLRALKETNRFVRGMVTWLGFRQTALHYTREARYAGDTKYPLRKMIRFAIDAITSFSTVPLRIATWLGLVAGLAAIGVGGWALYSRLFGDNTVAGWTTTMVAVSLGASAQLLMIGVLGEYVGRIFEEVKRRPLYVISEEINPNRESSTKTSDEATNSAPQASTCIVERDLL